MRWRLAICSGPLIVLATGIGGRVAFSAPLMQRVVSEGTASFQRIDAQRPSNNQLKHCLTRKGAASCLGAARGGKAARAPNPPEYPGGTSSAGTIDSLPLPSKAPSGQRNPNHGLERSAGDAQAGGPSPGLKFTGGMGMPTNRATLEGTLSPYQQPNGNTSAAQSGKLTNGLENQGMHFGFEFHY